MQLELVDPRRPDVPDLWRALDSQGRSYFTSWSWMENWLACVPRAHAIQLAVLRDGSRPVAACFLTVRSVARLAVLSSRAAFLNATGDSRLDEVCVEHNGLVGRDLGIGQLVDVLPADWDEVFLPGLHAEAFGGLGDTTVRGVRVRIDRTVPAPFVDLARVRDEGYLALLGSETRAQIRRARREAGTFTFEIATEAGVARAIYDELVELHQRQWQARGQPGVFADPWFERFHRRLISRRFAHGEIQLARLRSEGATIGCLYNFVYRGRVLQYQSGFAQLTNRHLKPGYLAHTEAIERAAAEGHTIYDFLGGDRRYKHSLSTGATTLVWARLQRMRMRFLVEDRVRAWIRPRRQPTA